MMERVKEKRLRITFGFEIYSSKIYVCSYSEKGIVKSRKEPGGVLPGSKFGFFFCSLSLRSMLQGYVIRFIFLNQNFIDAGSVHVDDFESEA